MGVFYVPIVPQRKLRFRRCWRSFRLDMLTFCWESIFHVEVVVKNMSVDVVWKWLMSWPRSLFPSLLWVSAQHSWDTTYYCLQYQEDQNPLNTHIIWISHAKVIRIWSCIRRRPELGLKSIPISNVSRIYILIINMYLLCKSTRVGCRVYTPQHANWNVVCIVFTHFECCLCVDLLSFTYSNLENKNML